VSAETDRNGDTPVTKPVDHAEDKYRRFRPSREAVEAATAALRTRSGADAAIVPMYMPGKTYGLWTAGQRVESVVRHGDEVLVAVNAHEPCDGIPTLREMEDRAFELAGAQLARIGPGTTAYAIVYRDTGHWTVFEEILSARTATGCEHDAPGATAG
jgi:hypothetical protein